MLWWWWFRRSDEWVGVWCVCRGARRLDTYDVHGGGPVFRSASLPTDVEEDVDALDFDGVAILVIDETLSLPRGLEVALPDM